MSDVRELLTQALSQAADYENLHYEYRWRFERVPTSALGLEMYSDDRDEDYPSQEYIDKVLAAYTEQEIITILAAARLEGVWTPE